MISLVPFYKDLSLSKDLKTGQIKARLEVFDYRKCLNYMYNTFYKFNPRNYQFIVQTDISTKFPNHYTLYRSEIDNSNLMKAIPQSNMNFVKNSPNGKYVLVGADHLICGRLDHFFTKDYDIGICVKKEWDNRRLSTVNNTVISVNITNKNKDNINWFFRERLNQYNNLPEELRYWWGDQASILYLIEKYGNPIKKYYQNNKNNKIINVNGLKIHLFEYGNDHMIKPIHKKIDEFSKKDDDVIIDLKGNSTMEFVDSWYHGIMNDKLR